jgi:hypothetical protein
MTEANTIDRISFLGEKFDVFEESDLEEKLKTLDNEGFAVEKIEGHGKLLALASSKKKGKTKYDIKRISVTMESFSSVIAADPTPNKSCVQWMLNVFARYCLGNESKDIAAAIRFVAEDLPQASEYITLFEANKRKNKFKELCKSSYILKKIKNPLDINQYKSLSQLYDAIDPFIVREPGTLESLLLRYVQAGDAEIPVKDRKFTLYIPLTLDASTIFEKFASWCTSRAGNSMFNSYTGRLTPFGTKSKLYIIINNKFFTGESQELYQLHFESDQLMDRTNTSQNVQIRNDVINQSEAIANFFHEELLVYAKANRKGMDDNKYLDYLLKFGFGESIFEVLDNETPAIRFLTREIPRIPSSIERFRGLSTLAIADAKLEEIDDSIGRLTNLVFISLPNNNIKRLPAGLGNLKNLEVINLSKNPLEEIPDEIQYLDKSRGGKLRRFVTFESDIGKANMEKLRTLLPNASFS